MICSSGASKTLKSARTVYNGEIIMMTSMMTIDDNIDDDDDDCTNANDSICQVGDGLRQHYTKTLRPFEEAHNFHTLHSPPLEVAITR